MKHLYQAFLLAILLLSVSMWAQSDYEALVQKGNVQLQAGHADLALASGEQAIKMDANHWEGYALAGGALMNLKQYERAADMFSKAIDVAPEAKQGALRELRRQCLLAESGAVPAASDAQTGNTTQAEVVLWKSIESSANPADFQTYLDQYPHGAFAALAERHLMDIQESAEQQRKLQQEQAAELNLDKTVWVAYPKMEGTPESGEGEIWVFLNGKVYWNSFGVVNDLKHPKRSRDAWTPALGLAQDVVAGRLSLDLFSKHLHLSDNGIYTTALPANVAITGYANAGGCKGPAEVWTASLIADEMTGTFSRPKGPTVTPWLNPFSSELGCDAANGNFKLQRLGRAP